MISTSMLFTFNSRLSKLIGTVFNLSVSKLSISGFKLAKSGILANYDAEIPATFYIRVAA